MTAATPAAVRGPGLPRRLTMLGPAFVAAIAYVDPGNFATDFSAGAAYGTRLLWVVVLASAIAVLIQFLSAKLGLATGRNLAELCRDRLPRPLAWGLAAQGLACAVATDLAEVVGGAVALDLLFGVPLVLGGALTVLAALGLLAATGGRRYRRFEVAVSVFLAVVAVGFVLIGIRVGLRLTDVGAGIRPALPDGGAAMLAAGIVGATVMPHAVYLHSDLSSRHAGRSAEASRTADAPTAAHRLRQTRLDVGTALGIAGLTNIAMLVIAARIFSGSGRQADSLESAHRGLAQTVGGGSALLFALCLLASGLAASAVGTYAGQVVMDGLPGMAPPPLVRRAVTTVPALAALASGANPTALLVGSQVVLSFGIPFVLAPLVLLTRDRRLMGRLANRPGTTAAASVSTALIALLNVVLVVGLLTGAGN